MYNIARLALLDRKALFDTYSFRFGTVREIVEKDFWVTLMLDYLFHKSEFKDIFTFKGGTSLSKCFHIIDRFSEDIDLILDWNALGVADEELYAQRSKTSQIRYNQKIEQAATEFIANCLLPSLKTDFCSILSDEPTIEIDSTDGHIINFYYPNVYNAQSAGLLQCIRLEIGPLAERVPSVIKNIEPLISNMDVPIMTQRDTSIKAISPERTFWEKVLILHQEAHRPPFKKDKNGNDVPNPIPRRYSRHYYDVWKISQTEYKAMALNDLDLLDRVIRFKKKFYNYSWDGLENAKPGKLVLIPNEQRINELRTDFISMKEMINDPSIKTFDELVILLKALEKELNKQDRLK